MKQIDEQTKLMLRRVASTVSPRKTDGALRKRGKTRPITLPKVAVGGGDISIEDRVHLEVTGHLQEDF